MTLARGIQLYTAVIIPHTHFPAVVADRAKERRESGAVIQLVLNL